MMMEYFKVLQISGHNFWDMAFILKVLVYMAVGLALFLLGYWIKGGPGAFTALFIGVALALYLNGLLWLPF